MADRQDPRECKHNYCKCCEKRIERSGDDACYRRCVLCDYQVRQCPDYEPKNGGK